MLNATSKIAFALMSERHKQFWRRHPGLVWSNPEADDVVHIRAALLRSRFDRLLDIAVEFGTEALKRRWAPVSRFSFS